MNSRKIYTAGLFLLFICSCLWAQKEDSLFFSRQLNEVNVLSSRNNFYNQDKHITRIDSTVIAFNEFAGLGEIVSLSSVAGINSSGSAGSVSSASLRGTAGNHVSVNWNGFPLNSLTTGTMDLSLISSTAGDDFIITQGAACTVYGSGAFGGAIDIMNLPAWNNRLMLKTGWETGQFHENMFSTKMKTGNKKIQYHVAFSYGNSLNDFTYIDNMKFNSPVDTCSHNTLKNISLVQNVFIRLAGNHSLEAGIWNQIKSKEIPRLMGSYSQSLAEQKDSTIKAFVKYTKRFNRSYLTVKSGYFSDHILYTDKNNANDTVYSIYSDIRTDRCLSDINFRYFFSRSLDFDAGIQYSCLTADLTQYAVKPVEHKAALFGGVKYLFRALSTVGSVRYEFGSVTDAKPVFSVGSIYPLCKDRMNIRFSFSSRFRSPSFNEKYWTPGGNPDLLPEYGWGAETGLDWIVSGKENEKYNLLFNVTFSSLLINNWIQWIPGNSFWYPENIKKVRANTMDAGIKYSMKLNRLKINVSSGYSFTSSVNAAGNESYVFRNKQLVYVPLHRYFGNIFCHYRSFHIGSICHFTGDRNTTDDNDPMYILPAYGIADMYFGKTFRFRGFEAVLKFRITNLFNISYQVIRAYPMPGREFHFGISIGFEKNNGSTSDLSTLMQKQWGIKKETNKIVNN